VAKRTSHRRWRRRRRWWWWRRRRRWRTSQANSPFLLQLLHLLKLSRNPHT